MKSKLNFREFQHPYDDMVNSSDLIL